MINNISEIFIENKIVFGIYIKTHHFWIDEPHIVMGGCFLPKRLIPYIDYEIIGSMTIDDDDDAYSPIFIYKKYKYFLNWRKKVARIHNIIMEKRKYD